MALGEIAKDAQRNILFNWTKLSAGDASVVQAILNRPSEAFVATTMRGTPHANFWTELVRLTWAEEITLPPALTKLHLGFAGYRLTELGKKVVPVLMSYWKLFELTAYNNGPKDQKPPVLQTSKRPR